MISLRPVREDDHEFMRALYGSTRADELRHFPFTDEQKAAFLDQQFHAQTVYYREHYPGSDWSIIEQDGAAIGRLLVDRRESEIRLMDIALLENVRSRGIGGALIREILEEGAAAGKPVTIHVEIYNPAMRLYERMGFRSISTSGVYHLMEWRAGHPQ